MPQSLAGILVHMIYSTKDRRPTIAGDVQHELNSYLAGVLRNLGCPAVLVGSVEDHIHFLFSLSRTVTVSHIAQETKVQSSKWMKRQAGPEPFAWQSGYGAFSVSQSHVSAVRAYIAAQEEHHRRRSFQEEFREFLDKYGVTYDERYVWE